MSDPDPILSLLQFSVPSGVLTNEEVASVQMYHLQQNPEEFESSIRALDLQEHYQMKFPTGKRAQNDDFYLKFTNFKKSRSLSYLQIIYLIYFLTNSIPFSILKNAFIHIFSPELPIDRSQFS